MGKAWGHSGPRVTRAPRDLSGFQEGALSPPPPLSATALREKPLVALGTGASRGHCPVSPVTQASWETGERVLAAAAAAAAAPEYSGIGFGGREGTTVSARGSHSRNPSMSCPGNPGASKLKEFHDPTLQVDQPRPKEGIESTRVRW